jgi:glyoxylase I family protein
MIQGLNHYNLRSDPETMEALKEFYTKIVGLKLGFRPPFKSNGYWLYAGNKDILHLSETKNDEKKDHHVNSTFDHMAFSAEDIEKFSEKLKANNIDFYYREVPEIGTKQIFFKDIVGNGIELIFTES